MVRARSMKWWNQSCRCDEGKKQHHHQLNRNQRKDSNWYIECQQAVRKTVSIFEIACACLHIHTCVHVPFKWNDRVEIDELICLCERECVFVFEGIPSTESDTANFKNSRFKKWRRHINKRQAINIKRSKCGDQIEIYRETKNYHWEWEWERERRNELVYRVWCLNNACAHASSVLWF